MNTSFCVEDLHPLLNYNSDFIYLVLVFNYFYTNIKRRGSFTWFNLVISISRVSVWTEPC